MIHLFVEGHTEKALKGLLRKCLPGVSLVVRTFDGKERLIKEARVLVGDALWRGADAVFALADLHPVDRSPEALKQRMTAAVSPEHRHRFHPHVAVHDVEAWMLASWGVLCEVAGCKGQRYNLPAPETVNLTKPPKEHVKDLFRRHRSATGYRPAVDGSKVLELADPDEIAGKCSHFRALRDDLRECAGVG